MAPPEDQLPGSNYSDTKSGAANGTDMPLEKWYKRDKLTLEAIATDLIERESFPGSQKFHDPPEKWDGYFQSPVSKAAWTLDFNHRGEPSFGFDEHGALRDTSVARPSYGALNTWLGRAEQDSKLEPWMNGDGPPAVELCACLRKKLSALTLRSDHLDGQPICRLVRADQLRYDPNYQAVYQLTPAELRLIKWEGDRRQSTPEGTHEPGATGNPLLEVQRNQRIYWALSEAFQSLVAMFDSDLGGEIKAGQLEQIRKSLVERGFPEEIEVTKDLMAVTLEGDESKESITPTDLNTFSPMRYWAPPPVFARSVFHMLFWQPLLTGSDLFHRPFPDEIYSKGNDVESLLRARVGFYYVEINTFQAANYRITDYSALLDLLVTVADGIQAKIPKHKIDEPLDFLDAIDLSKVEDASGGGFLAHLFYKDQGLEPPIDDKLRILIPPSHREDPGGKAVIWELAAAYCRAPETTKGTTARHLLLMLRDRILQLILWAHFQMEIRSVGPIAIQRLYRVELTRKGYGEIEGLLSLPRGDQWKDNVDRALSEAIKNQSIEDWVRFVKVHDRSLPKLLDLEGTWIDPLKNR